MELVFCTHANDTSYELCRQLLGINTTFHINHTLPYLEINLLSKMLYQTGKLTRTLLYPNQLEQMILLPTNEARLVLLREFMREYAKGVGHGEL